MKPTLPVNLVLVKREEHEPGAKTEPGSGSEGSPEPRVVARLRARREWHRERGRIYRTIWVVGGFVVLLAGLAMTVLPGPAIVVIPLGLAMLSLEFSWAQRLLERALDRGMAAKERASRSSNRGKLLIGAAATAVAAAGATAAAIYAL